MLLTKRVLLFLFETLSLDDVLHFVKLIDLVSGTLDSGFTLRYQAIQLLEEKLLQLIVRDINVLRVLDNLLIRWEQRPSILMNRVILRVLEKLRQLADVCI